MDLVVIFSLGGAAAFALIYLKNRYLSFAAQLPQDYADDGPQIDIRRHLNGPLTCEGVIYGPTGRVTSRFVGDFEAHWIGNRGVMTEHFQYDSGNTQDRQWALVVGEDGKIEASAPDLIGMGTGAQAGSAAQLKYRIRLTEEAGGHVLDVTDWMYLAPNGTIVNRSQFRKFGVKVAELVATMRPASQACAHDRDAA